MRIASALRLASAAALVSLAACSDNAPTGADSSAVTLKAASVRTEIALNAPAGAPYAAAKGKAKYDTGNPELQVEAENIPAGTAVTFKLGIRVIGTGTASALGKVSLNLRGAAAPKSVAGMGVSVNRASDDAVIVSGGF